MADQYDQDSDDEPQPFDVDLQIRQRDVGRADVDHQYFMERFTGEMTKKVLVPKTKTFDIMARIDSENRVAVQVCSNFDPSYLVEPPYAYPQYFKNAFQTEPDFTSGYQMISSSIVGWCAETGFLFLVNPIDLGDLAEDILPMSDIICPIFVSGPKLQPVTPDVFDNNILGYEPGAYLVLSDYPGLGSVTVEISVHKTRSIYPFKVNTYRAEIELYVLYLNPDPDSGVFWKGRHNFGKIERIIDRDNSLYGVYGMYAGGPLPPVVHRQPRICWDQPRITEEYGFGPMEGSFRFDIDYQRGGRRVGYYCSRDALFAVREIIRMRREMVSGRTATELKSLLKEYTYVICDGYNTFLMYSGMGERPAKCPFRDLDGDILGPLIVVVPEGLSCLSVKEHKDHSDWRKIKYYNESPAQPPIVFNWRRFQRDFIDEVMPGLAPPIAPPPVAASQMQQWGVPPPQQQEQWQPLYAIEQVMYLQDIPDYVVYSVENTKYVFSLKQVPNFFYNQQRLDDYYYVFGRLSEEGVPPQSARYYYLGRISNSYFLKKRRDSDDTHLVYNWTYFYNSGFPPGILDQYNPTQQEMVRSQQLAANWRNISRKEEFKFIVRYKLLSVSHYQWQHPSINAISRDQKVGMVKTQNPGLHYHETAQPSPYQMMQDKYG